MRVFGFVYPVEEDINQALISINYANSSRLTKNIVILSFIILLMKKYFLLILFLAFGAFAQEKGNVEIGVNYGLNLSRVTAFSGESLSPQTGYNAGLSLEYFFSKRWGLKTEVVYDTKGWKESYAYTNTNLNLVISETRLNYVTIPLMATLHFGAKNNWYLNLGPYIGFLLDAEDVESGADLTEDYNSNDFGVAFTAGYRFNLSDNVKLFLEYDLQQGVENIFSIDTAVDYDIVNGRSGLNVGFLFEL
jgi:opacity protein-like surface antigen